jgi:hypothetical protein
VRDLFGAMVAVRDVPSLADAHRGELLDEDWPPPPLTPTVLPPGTRLVTFGSRQHAPSTCPLTAGPATFGACLGCVHCRGAAGMGMACEYS